MQAACSRRGDRIPAGELGLPGPGWVGSPAVGEPGVLWPGLGSSNDGRWQWLSWPRARFVSCEACAVPVCVCDCTPMEKGSHTLSNTLPCKGSGVPKSSPAAAHKSNDADTSAGLCSANLYSGSGQESPPSNSGPSEADDASEPSRRSFRLGLSRENGWAMLVWVRRAASQLLPCLLQTLVCLLGWLWWSLPLPGSPMETQAGLWKSAC